MDIERYQPGEFDAEQHYYPRAVNAQLHPLVASFVHMPLRSLALRYVHMHPQVDRDALQALLTTAPRHFHWAGCDLFNVVDEVGTRRKLVVETNSCPSGQKHFPLLDEESEEGGYRRLMERTFLPLVRHHLEADAEQGLVCVFWDKNHPEASGYAQVLATLLGREVWLVPWTADAPERFVHIDEGRVFVRLDGTLRRVTCALRYVTQRPWARIPVRLETPVLNPILTCLAGGRNKAAAYAAYEQYNRRHRQHGLTIEFPETFTHVRLAEVPMYFERLGRRAVVKVPYMNAGQGVYTLVNRAELDAFMAMKHPYDEFVVQQLVGNYRWSSTSALGRLYNIGTLPDRHDDIYFFDIRAMVSWQQDRWAPVALYARRARQPMRDELDEGARSWDVLGTNLSTRHHDGSFGTEPRRLLMMDRRDYRRLGLGIDDLIDVFVQSVMATRAVDDMATRLVSDDGDFDRNLYRALSNDETLLAEILG